MVGVQMTNHGGEREHTRFSAIAVAMSRRVETDHAETGDEQIRHEMA